MTPELGLKPQGALARWTPFPTRLLLPLEPLLPIGAARTWLRLSSSCCSLDSSARVLSSRRS